MLLDELRRELHAEPITASADVAAGYALLTEELDRWQQDSGVIGRALGGDGREQAEAGIVAATAHNLRRVMLTMGCYVEDEMAEAERSVVVSGWDGGVAHVEFWAPRRVAAYMDAIQAGEFARAEGLLRG